MINELRICEETGWKVRPAPPNRMIRGGVWGGAETKESKALGIHWNRLGDKLKNPDLEERKKACLEYEKHYREVHGA